MEVERGVGWMRLWDSSLASQTLFFFFLLIGDVVGQHDGLGGESHQGAVGPEQNLEQPRTRE